MCQDVQMGVWTSRCLSTVSGHPERGMDISRCLKGVWISRYMFGYLMSVQTIDQTIWVSRLLLSIQTGVWMHMEILLCVQTDVCRFNKCLDINIKTCPDMSGYLMGVWRNVWTSK